MELEEAIAQLTGTVTLSFDTLPASYINTADWTLTIGDDAVFKTNESCTITGSIDVCQGVLGDFIGSDDYPISIEQRGNQIVVERLSNNGFFDQNDTYIFTTSASVLNCADGEIQVGNNCETLAQCPEGLIFDGSACAAPAECRDDQVLDGNSCVCPAGEVEVDGLCQVPAPECRDDQVIVNNTCVCPAGEQEIDGICQIPPVQETVYVLTNATFSNLFGSGTYTNFSGSLTDTAGTLAGDVVIEYVNGTAGFDYNGNWTTTVGSEIVFKANESCANTGSQNACGPIVGDRDTTQPVSQSGNTITIVHETGGFPNTTETYTFTAQ